MQAAGSSSSTPQQPPEQQRSSSTNLDALLSAHLPEFVAALSAGLSPVKKTPSPSPGMQRSFSAIQLVHHQDGGDAAAVGMHCWTDDGGGGNSGTSACSSTGSPDSSRMAQGAAAAATAAAQPTVQQHKQLLPPCPVLWRPPAGMPLAESVETHAEEGGAGAAPAGAPAAAPALSDPSLQQHEGDGAGSAPASPAAARAASRSSQLQSSSIANLMQMLHGLLGKSSSGSGTSSKLHVAVPAADGDEQGVDVGEFISCYSPDSTGSRQYSRAASSSGAKATAAHGSPQQQPGRISSASSSPRASGSFPDLNLFWSNYSAAGSNAPSRHASGVTGAATAQQQQQQKQHSGCAAAAAAAASEPAAAGAEAAAPAEAGASGEVQGVAGWMLPLSPSPSKGSMLLHGPSRLSLRTSLQDSMAAAAVAAASDAGGAGSPRPEGQQAQVVAAAAADQRQPQQQQQQDGPLRQNLQKLASREATTAAAAAEGGAAQQQQQQQQVHRKLFGTSKTQAGSDQQGAPAQATSQQQPQHAAPAEAAAAAPASPGKQQSLLWSLMHRHKKGHSSKQQPSAVAPAAELRPAAVVHISGDRQALAAAELVVTSGSAQQAQQAALEAPAGRCPVVHIASRPTDAAATTSAVGPQLAGRVMVLEEAQQRHAVVSISSIVGGPARHEAGDSAASHAAADPQSTLQLLSAEHRPVVNLSTGTEVTAAAACSDQAQPVLAEPAANNRGPPVVHLSCAAGTTDEPTQLVIPGVLAAAAAGAGGGISSNAADVVAGSMQRIASCLEGYLCDRSPSVSPTRLLQGTTWAPAAVTSTAGGCRPDQGMASGAGAAASSADAVHQLTPSKAAAWSANAAAAAWSPAAAAAKARMLSAASPGKQQQAAAAQGAVGGAQDTCLGVQGAHSDQDSSSRGADRASGLGWVHPTDVRPVAPTARADRPAGAAQPHQQHERQQQWQEAGATTSAQQLPRSLRPPPGLGLTTTTQQQMRHTVQATLHDDGRGAAGADNSSDQLATLFALACKAVGVQDLLQDSQQAMAQAAPPAAVTAAALTAAMAAAATAFHRQQQQPEHQAESCHQKGSSGVLWRPSADAAPEQQQQPWMAALQGGTVRGSQPHGARQQQQQPGHRLGYSADSAAGGVKLLRRQQPGWNAADTAAQEQGRWRGRLLEPERATHLRLLRPGLHNSNDCGPSWSHHPQEQLRADCSYPGHAPAASNLWQPHNHQQQQQVPGVPPQLVRLPVQQPAAAPLQPPVLLHAQPAAAPWLHPAANSSQPWERPGAAVSSAAGYDLPDRGWCTPRAGLGASTSGSSGRQPQQAAPWQPLGYNSSSSRTGAAGSIRPLRTSAGGDEQCDAAGMVAGRSRLSAGAAAARLLHGLEAEGGGCPQQQQHTEGDYWQVPQEQAGAAAASHSYQEQQQQTATTVIEAHNRQQQQNLAPWQQSSTAEGHAVAKTEQQRQQQRAPLAPLQQNVRAVSVPHSSPVKSPRKQQQQQPAGRRWALLQRLKAINTAAHKSGLTRTAAAAAGSNRPGGVGGGNVAAQLIAQLQDLMQGPAGAVHAGSEAVPCGQAPADTGISSISSRPDLDAAAATALLHVPAAAPAQGTADQHSDSSHGAGLAEQSSMHSAAAQTSEALLLWGHDVADAAVQAADVGAGAEQAARQQGALELAHLILDAFDKSGGRIVPEDGAGNNSNNSSSGIGGIDWGCLLPNPLAGPAAPQFLQVDDLQLPPGGGEGLICSPQGASEGLQPDPQQWEQVTCRVESEQQPQQEAEQPAGGFTGGSSHSTPQHGCCFAACPRHISSPELGTQKQQPQQQSQRSARTARSAAAKQQPQSRTAGRGGWGAAPTLPRRAHNNNSTAQSGATRAAAGGRVGSKSVSSKSKQPATSPATWACEQTKQLDELWQQWTKQQQQQQQAPSQQQQQLLDDQQRQELEDAYARAGAARAAANKQAAQRAAASRSARLRAELLDVGRMLAEVDSLAAQMEAESTQTEAAVQAFADSL